MVLPATAPDTDVPDPPAAAPAEAEPPIRLQDSIGFGARVFAAVWAGWAALGLLGTGTFAAQKSVGVPGVDATPITPGWHNLIVQGNHADALWYQRIASGGYRADDPSAAFFPLFPMLARGLGWIGIPAFPATLLLAQVAFFGALVVMHALTRRELGEQNARRAVRYLAVFPTAFFFLSPFTESLFLLLALLTFWFARTGRWWWAAAPALLAGLTRSVGIVLCAALLAEAVQQHLTDRRSSPGTPASAGALAARALAVAAPAIGLVIYLSYWQSQGNLTAPMDAQAQWGKVWTLPNETLWHAAKFAWQYQSYWLLDLLVTAVPLVTVIAGAALRILRPGYVIYALASLALPLTAEFASRPLMSVPRYVAVLFPTYWVLAVAVERRRLSGPLVLGISVGGFALLGLLFINAYSIF